MRWTDAAIVLSARKHGENSAVARLFSREHGVFSGVVRGIHSRAGRGVVQPGNLVNANWQARLSEQLGSFHTELLEANAALIMTDGMRLAALSSACALLETALPERHPYPKLYRVFEEFLATLTHALPWPEAYVRLELDVLAESGFGLDLRSCAATGATQDLIYVSPKSGRAVSREAGEPYKDKLLALPSFLLPGNETIFLEEKRDKGSIKSAEILAGMELTGYFLAHWLLTPHHRKLPAARGRLLQFLHAEGLRDETRSA